MPRKNLVNPYKIFIYKAIQKCLTDKLLIISDLYC